MSEEVGGRLAKALETRNMPKNTVMKALILMREHLAWDSSNFMEFDGIQISKRYLTLSINLTQEEN